jgi:hypothetical protein
MRKSMTPWKVTSFEIKTAHEADSELKAFLKKRIQARRIDSGGNTIIEWGEPVDDLQLGLAFDQEKQAYAPREEITLQIYARNNGDSEVPLSWADLSLKPPSVVPSKKLHITKGSASPSGGGVYIMPNNILCLITPSF